MKVEVKAVKGEMTKAAEGGRGEEKERKKVINEAGSGHE